MTVRLFAIGFWTANHEWSSREWSPNVPAQRCSYEAVRFRAQTRVVHQPSAHWLTAQHDTRQLTAKVGLVEQEVQGLVANADAYSLPISRSFR